MLNVQLEEVNELLALLAQTQARISSIETTLVLCSFGLWEGPAAQEAQESRRQMVMYMNHAQEHLATARAHLDDYRSDLHTAALAFF